MVENLPAGGRVGAVRGENAIIRVLELVAGGSAGHVGHLHGATRVLRVVEDFELVLVGVAEKLAGDGRFVAVDDAVEVLAPRLQATRRVVVRENVDFFRVVLARLKSLGQPVQLTFILPNRSAIG